MRIYDQFRAYHAAALGANVPYEKEMAAPNKALSICLLLMPTLWCVCGGQGSNGEFVSVTVRLCCKKKGRGSVVVISISPQ